jgi:hypothetical protein
VFLVAVLVGVGLGVFSQLADGIIEGRLILILGNMAAPWALAAFVVGFHATSVKEGAVAAAVTLVVGVAVYYLGGAVRGYADSTANLVWTVVALIAGPIMGACGAAVSIHRTRPPIVAVVVPSATLVAQGLFLLIDANAWRWNLAAEPYRLNALGVAVALVVGGFLLARFLLRDAHTRRAGYLFTAVAGVAGAYGLVVIGRIVLNVISASDG